MAEISDEFENFFIFHYKTNNVEPMRRNYLLTTKMNNFMGQRIAFEEIDSRFLRFIHTKNYFESMLVMNTRREGWEEYFQSKKISLTHPTILAFFEIVAKWEKRKSS